MKLTVVFLLTTSALHSYAADNSDRATSSSSTNSLIEAVQAIQWTDASLVPRETPIKANHVSELRTYINNKRTACGLNAQAWTDDPLVPRQTPIKKIHIDELRTSLEGLPSSDGSTTRTFTDANIVSRQTLVRAVHIEELRNYAYNATCPAPPSTPSLPVATTPRPLNHSFRLAAPYSCGYASAAATPDPWSFSFDGGVTWSSSAPAGREHAAFNALIMYMSSTYGTQCRGYPNAPSTGRVIGRFSSKNHIEVDPNSLPQNVNCSTYVERRCTRTNCQNVTRWTCAVN
ncbi:MAG: hypothetical protein AAGB31_00960 [Bdellovibrio sp.]